MMPRGSNAFSADMKRRIAPTATLPTDLEEALAEIARRSSELSGDRRTWQNSGANVPISILKLIEAAQAGRLKIGETYNKAQLISFVSGEHLKSILELQFDLAIWRVPFKLVEDHRDVMSKYKTYTVAAR